MRFINVRNLWILCLLFVGNFTMLRAEVIEKSYTASDLIIANPERGLQKYSITNAQYYTETAYTNLSLSNLQSMREGSEKVTVLFRYFLLAAYLEQDIPETYLANIQKDFDVIRDAGLKCIVRFSYSNSQSTALQQPVKAQLLKHITQLKGVLASNADIILTHQAGFLGTWGEWYYTNSDEFGTDGTISALQWENRKEIIDAMLSATPEDIPLQVRYPEIKKRMYGETFLTEESAYKNTAQARIGFFNDAFLNNWGDMGTFGVNSKAQTPVGTEDYLYLSNETQYTPMSGETNGINAPRTDGDNAVFEMDSCNWTNLNRDYFTANWDNWIASDHYNEILKNLGYRFVLQKSQFEKTGNQLSIVLNLENVGFARLFKKRNATLVLKNKSSSEEFLFSISNDPRTWEGLVIIEESFDISALPLGTYRAYLNLPDVDSALQKNSHYAIQFANSGVWVDSLGYNDLQQEVVIETTASLEDVSHQSKMLHSIHAEAKTITVYKGASQSFGDRVTLFDAQGRLIQSLPFDEAFKVTFFTESLSAGIYFISMGEDNSRSAVSIVVE